MPVNVKTAERASRLGREWRGLLVPLLALGWATGSAPVWAQAPAAAPAAPAEAEQPKVKIERGAGGRKVYRITSEIHIDGKIQKPEAFYVLQKSGINYDWQELKQEFLPKILDSVSRSPF